MESRGRHRWGGYCLSFRLCGLLLEVGDQVVPVLALLETTERHLGSGNVLLWVLEVHPHTNTMTSFDDQQVLEEEQATKQLLLG